MSRDGSERRNEPSCKVLHVLVQGRSGLPFRLARNGRRYLGPRIEEREGVLRVARYSARAPVAESRLRYDAARAEVASDRSDGPYAGGPPHDGARMTEPAKGELGCRTASSRDHP